MQKILFVNHKGEKCGVYQYGVHFYEKLLSIKSFSFAYVECSNSSEVKESISKHNPVAIIYNYHEGTLAFVNQAFLNKMTGPIHICLAHELLQDEIDKIDGRSFDYYLLGDPDFIENNPRVFKLCRFLFPYNNNLPVPSIPTLGTYGFASKVKGYKDFIKMVEKEFDQAIIRINIAPHSAADPNGQAAVKLAEKLRKNIKKPNVKLEITHRFFSDSELLDFLAQNTLNVFMYDPFELCAMRGGISSAVDQAISVKRPIAITNNLLLRHLFSTKPSILIKYWNFKIITRCLRSYVKSIIKPLYVLIKYKDLPRAKKCRDIAILNLRLPFRTLLSFKRLNFNSLEAIINNGIKPFEHLFTEWSDENFQKRFTAIMSKIFARHEHEKKRFNRILDDKARVEYEETIQALFKYNPQIIKRKVRQANVQQAFVLDTVRRFATPYSKTLSVGCFEDTAYLTLVKQHYNIEGIDPGINHDLNTFFNLPTTIKGSYDVVFSTSVIEHVEEDELFVKQISELLAPGGIGIITCDFHDQWKPEDGIFSTSFRFYTRQSLKERLIPSLTNCTLIDEPDWNCDNPDFEFGGKKYTFATFVFQKGESSSPYSAKELYFTGLNA
jgi:hypothetical protein